MASKEDDSEPPSKRVKPTPAEDYASSSSGHQMRQDLPAQGNGEQRIGTKRVIRKQEFIRVIASALHSLGYRRTVDQLQQESEISMHSAPVHDFWEQVLGRKWDESLATLKKLNLSKEEVDCSSLVILEQKFLELLEKDKRGDARNTLKEVAGLNQNIKEVRELAYHLVFYDKTRPVSSPLEALKKLEKVLPAGVIVTGERLLHLVEDALAHQLDSCVFHNIPDREFSLYTDHRCETDQFPSHSIQQYCENLGVHGSEVRCLRFSQSGRYLASTSQDGSVFVWKVLENGRVSLKHRLLGHTGSVITVSWRTGDDQLLTCGQEDVIKRWDVDTGQCLIEYLKRSIGYISCGWFPNTNGFVAGATDGTIKLWDLDGLDGKALEDWYRGMFDRSWNHGLTITNDGNKMISICRGNAILIVDREANLARNIEEDEDIMSFSLSADNKFLLVNLFNQEIHLWSIEGDLKVVSKYQGPRRTRSRSRFLLRSCFGGCDEAFIASGSKDRQVYIWNRRAAEPVKVLVGHLRAVTCVSWNPANPSMLASGDRGGTIQIWGPGPSQAD